MTEINLDHIHPSFRDMALQSPEERIRYTRTDRWFGYTRAKEALARLEDLLDYPQRTRMPNLLLVGPTNGGKSFIIQRFRRDHPPSVPINAGAQHIPVVGMQMPATPDQKRFYSALLDAIGAPQSPGDQLVKKERVALQLLKAVKVRMLIIDELHSMLAGRVDQQRAFLNLLRFLGNELQIPLVGVGTREALRAVQSDEQLANRFEPFALPLWEDGEEYRKLMASLVASLPLHKPSALRSPALSGKILHLSGGVLGEIISLVNRAAIRAIETGTEQITLEMIDRVSGMSPAMRRAAVANIG